MNSEVKKYIDRIYNVNGEGYNGGSLRAAEINNNNPMYAIKAVEMTEEIMTKKAVEAFKENCQYPKDAKACECKLCVRNVGGNCELLEGFIKKLNN